MDNHDTVLHDLDPIEIEASVLQKVACTFIDFIVEIVTMVALFFVVKTVFLRFFNLNTFNTFFIYLIVVVVMIGYRLVCVLFFNKTIGMAILRLKYLNAYRKPLSTQEKWIAAAPVRTSKAKLYKEIESA